MGITEIRNLKSEAEYPKKSKRDKQQQEYEKLRKIYLKNHPLCECGCGRKSSEIHHEKGRIGNLLTDTRYFKALSRTCHRDAELNPKKAKANGLSKSRLSK